MESMEPNHILSKSTFIRGCQCEKSLYLYKNENSFKTAPSISQQSIFDKGTEVGILAIDLFPGGVDASASDALQYQKSLIKTQELISNNISIIYEATFQFDKVLASVDILTIKTSKVEIYEVKSSTEVKDVHVLDAALQYYIITRLGFQVTDIFIVYINNKYIREGGIDLNQLFIKQSVIKEVINLQEFVHNKIANLKSVLLNNTLPTISIGQYCSEPYECDFMAKCWDHIPKVSIFNLSRFSTTKKFELYASGVIEFSQLHEDYKLTNGQRMQVECYLNKKEIINVPTIKEFISTINYPICFMDFETFQSPVPLFNKSKAYQQIPFQFSVHIKLNKDSEPTHLDFLAEPGIDPREHFILSLMQATAGTGTILVYNKTFEISRLKELALDFPNFKDEIESRIARIVDLMIPFSKKWYYTAKMNGSYSIKAVLPALVSELRYADLEISDGANASATFLNLLKNEDKSQVEAVRLHLTDYCKRDTFAMVEILKKLEMVSNT